MSESDNIAGGSEDSQVLVAEYVLGLLGAGEHERVRTAIAASPVLQGERRMWQTRFAALDRQFVETPAPAHILPAIEARLFGTAEKPTGWWNNLLLWRSLATGALAVAAVAIGFNVLRPAQLDPQEFATQLVAALQAQEGSGVEFVALYDTASGTLRLRGLTGETPPDRDFELWYISGSDAPVSMGVIPIEGRTEVPLDAATRAKLAEGTILAISLEPKGGSPTGTPTQVVSAGAAQSI
jgi:anti-sigma-K factor RskA